MNGQRGNVSRASLSEGSRERRREWSSCSALMLQYLSEGIDQSGSNVGSNAPGLHIAFNVIGTAVAWSLSSCEDLKMEKKQWIR